MVKIYIDPGHGGRDPGAAGNGLQEKNIALKVAAAVRDILLNEYTGASILMSRTGDQTVSLRQRTDAANNWGADFHLSIHVNTGGGTGFESFIYPGTGAPTTTYQDAVHEQVLQAVSFANRGQKTANFHVLRETRMPALLTENGFIDNSADAGKLKSSIFLNSLARGHAIGIARAFRLSRKRPTPPATGLYKVQIGAFKSKGNADSLAEGAKAKGFEAIVLLRDGLYKVQIGAFSSKDNAEALGERAKAAGFNVFIFRE